MQARPQVHHQLWGGGGAGAARVCVEHPIAKAGAHAALSSWSCTLAGAYYAETISFCVFQMTCVEVSHNAGNSEL